MSVEIFVVPISAVVLINLFYPYLWTLRSDEYMFNLPFPFILGLYIASFFLLGYTIYLGDLIGNSDIYTAAIVLTVFNIIWGMTFQKNANMTIAFLFASLFVAYIVYNEIFLSELTDNGTTLYLNLYSGFIIFLGFMIAVAIEKFKDSKTYMEDDRKFKRKFFLR